MGRIYLQHMVEDIPDSLLPQAWVDHDLEFFSHAKRLYDYQQQALRNALKALWKYYGCVESPLTPTLSPLHKGGEGAGGMHTASGGKGAGRVESPLTPTLSPLHKGGEGEGSGGIHPRYRYLPIDTKHFPDLELPIVALFDNLDEALDGWLIKSENYQALNTILPKFRGKVKCVYIDPPYNTGNDQFIYKDRYQHSSWLTMMADRLALSAELMREDSILFMNIDDNEFSRLSILADTVLGRKRYSEYHYLNTFVWINNLKGRQIAGRGAARTHEYVLAYGSSMVGKFLAPVAKLVDIMPSVYKGFDYETREDEAGLYVIKNELYNTNSKFNEETRPNLVFNIHYNFTTGEIRFSEVNEKVEYEGFVKIPPKPNNDGIHKYHAWRWGKDKILRCKSDLEFVKTKEGVRIYTKDRDFQTTALKDVISDISTSDGNKEHFDLFGQIGLMEHPKPVLLVELFIGQTKEEELVLDFFAGSGTTAHAVINLNREEGSRRKYILIEMANYFYTILLPRIKKVIFSDKWREGKAQQEGKGISHFVQYCELEQFEDVLHVTSYAKDDLLAPGAE